MDIPTYLQRAQNAVKEGELDLALQYYQQILGRYPNNPDALQGVRDIELEKARKRLPLWKRELKLIWDQCMMSIGRAGSVYEDLALLHQLQPEHERTASAFAACCEKTGRLEEAHQAHQQVLRINATNQTSLKADAEILIRLDRLDEASELYQRLLALRPGDDAITHRLRDISAKAYARVGIPENLKERRAAIEKAKKEDPIPDEVKVMVKDLLTKFQANPDNQQAGVDAAAIYRRFKFYDHANQILGSILDRNPSLKTARREQARVWHASGELAIAVNLYEELLAEDPHDQALKDEFLVAKAEWLEQRIKAGKADRESVNTLERIKIERDKNRISLLKKVLAEHPEAFDERIELGELLLKYGRPDEAIPILQRLVHEPSYAGKGLFLLGQCFRAKGNIPLAVQQYEKSLEFFKNRGYSHVLTEELKNLYYQMGSAKEEIDDLEGAREAYSQVYSADIHFKDIKSRYENLYKAR